MSVTFVGIALELESVTQLALATVRVRFTQDPLATSSSGVHDALNPANYTLSGPGIANVASCGTVYGDTQSIDLFLSGPLPAGVWTLTASPNIQTATGSGITAPLSLQFNVTIIGANLPVNPGTTNDAEEDLIRKHLNPGLQGLGWDALIAAIATGETTNRDNAELAFQQLFTSTASGLYLERKASDAGIQRPDNMGMADATFREYAIRVTNNKLTEESFLEVLEVFYGDSSLRASNATAKVEPYAFHDGDDLTIVIDGEITVPVVFRQSDFAIIGIGKAVEVAFAITRACRIAGSEAYAAANVDPQTGLSTVTIYSGALGLASSVQVLGGKAQNVLQFDTLLPVYGTFSSFTWNITANPSTDTMRFTTTSAVVDMTKLLIGDYVNIFGSEFNALNRGSFTITNVNISYPAGVLTQYFEVMNINAVAQTGLSQAVQNDVLYFRPTRDTIHATQERAVIVSVPGNEVNVVLPATSQAVSRNELTAAYGQVAPSIAATSLQRIDGVVTVTAPNHGLSIGQNIIVDGAIGNLGAAPNVAGNTTTTTSYSPCSIDSLMLRSNTARQWPAVVARANQLVSLAGAGSGGTSVNTIYMEAVTSTSFPLGTQYTLTNSSLGLYTNAAHCGAIVMTHPLFVNNVMAAGGTNDGGTNVSTCTVLTPAGSNSATGSLATAMSNIMLSETVSKSIVGFGGATADNLSKTTIQIFNPVTATWSNSAAVLSQSRIDSALLHVTINAVETILVIGGRSLDGTGTQLVNFTGTGNMGVPLRSVEQYAVLANTNAASTLFMTYTRFGHQIFSIGNNRYIVVGGWGSNPTQSTTPALLSTTEILDLNIGEFVPGPPMTVGRAFYAGGIINNKLYVMGGTTASTKIEYLDLTSMKWETSTAVLDSAIGNAAGAVINGSILAMVGGANSSATVQNTIRVLTPGSDKTMSGGLNGSHVVASVIDSNTFTFTTKTTSFVQTGAAIITPQTAPASNFAGPYSFDLSEGIAVTGSESNVTVALAQGLQYNSVTVADATIFPDAPGWLVFDFGYSDEVEPVQYFGRLSSTQLALDYSYRFPNNVNVGAKCCLLIQKGPWVPDEPQTVGSFYLTDSPVGRIAAQSAITSIAASGVNLNITVTYPGNYGLGNWGFPESNNHKVSDEVYIWGSDDPDQDEATARGSD